MQQRDLSAPVTPQFVVADKSRVIMSETDELDSQLTVSDDVIEATSAIEQALGMSDTSGMVECEAADMSTEMLSSTMDSAAGCLGEMNEDLSVKCHSDMSAQQWKESVVNADAAELNALTSEGPDLEQRLIVTRAELQTKDAECLRLRDTIADLERQFSESSRLLDESRDHEDDLQRAVEACQAELRQNDGRWHEVVETKEQTIRELRADLEALTGSVQRREYTWDVARQSMEEQIETMRHNLAQQTAHYDTQVQVRGHCPLD